jgi:hypothetical protein
LRVKLEFAIRIAGPAAVSTHASAEATVQGSRGAVDSCATPTRPSCTRAPVLVPRWPHPSSATIQGRGVYASCSTPARQGDLHTCLLFAVRTPARQGDLHRSSGLQATRSSSFCAGSPGLAILDRSANQIGGVLDRALRDTKLPSSGDTGWLLLSESFKGLSC